MLVVLFFDDAFQSRNGDAEERIFASINTYWRPEPALHDFKNVPWNR